MRFTDQNNISIIFSNEVLELFKYHRQVTSKNLEAGGQLFARFSNGDVIISKATGLREGDKRGRYLFWPNRKKEREEIMRLYDEGFHYVGDWHTHPEPKPTPSNIDLINIQTCFNQSKHDLKYFVMAIIGTASFPEGLHVSIHNTTYTIILNYDKKM